jgi:hypothetical protein
MNEAVDVAEFVSDYVTMIRECGEQVPPRKKLAEEIVEALADRGHEATVEQVEYYL